MLDGVEWAAAEIAFYMMLATLIGFAIAYVFIRWFQKGSIAEGYEVELAAQQELTRTTEQRLVESNDTIDRLQLELRGEHQRVADLEGELKSALASIADLEAAVPDEDELAQMQTALDASHDEATRSSSRVAELEEEIAVKEQTAALLGDSVAELEKDLGACRANAGALQARVSELESALVAEEARIGELEISESVAADSTDSATLPAPDDGDGPSQEEGLERIAEIAARTAGAGPIADDDLKKVHGIGPKLERTLKELGITSFRQIARFEADDIAYVTAALDAFKGRIERDDWMGSAAAEHIKKYGEPA